MVSRERLTKNSRRGLYFAPPSTVELVSSGCSLLDCCLGGGWAERIVNLVGDKSTGKTLLACELAANYLKKYPDAIIYYRDFEAAFDPDYMESMGIPAEVFDYGENTAGNVEDVFEELSSLIAKKRRCLYIGDSLDALSDRAEQDRGIEEGTFGTNKARKLSELFRRLVKQLKQADVMVMFISQVRDKIGVQFGERHTRTGGRALDFYCSQIVWLSQLSIIKRTVRKIERPIGISVRAKVKKNKVGPPFREVDFPILFGYGSEDLVSSINFLQKVKALDEAGITKEQADDWSSFRYVASMDQQEYNHAAKKARIGARKVWKRIEHDFSPGERRKYGG